MTPPLIALEEHYYSKAVFASLGDKFQHTLSAVPGLAEQLLDLGDGRLEAMDNGQISLQVISHAFTPGKAPHAGVLQHVPNVHLLQQAPQAPKAAKEATTSSLPVSRRATKATASLPWPYFLCRTLWRRRGSSIGP
jgi:hypothetical protein